MQNLQDQLAANKASQIIPQGQIVDDMIGGYDKENIQVHPPHMSQMYH